jgi:hypothetical protein
MSGDDLPGSPKRSDGRMVIEYIKSQHFRVVHVDGGIGGPTPSGHIHFAVFSERPAIPRRLVANVAGGVIGDPIPEETIVRDGMIRELDIDMIMPVSAAEEIGKLLTKVATDLKEALEKNTKHRGRNE